MGVFSSITNNWHKSEAAATIETLLERQQQIGFFNLDPAKVATFLISKACDAMPDVFSGKLGKRPDRTSLAAFALANGIMTCTNEEYHSSFLIALGAIIEDISRRKPQALVEDNLLSAACFVFNQKTNEPHPLDKELDVLARRASNTPASRPFSRYVDEKEVGRGHGRLSYATYEEWYASFKESSAKTHRGLLQPDGRHRADTMDQGPLRKAFCEKADPVRYGQDFGRRYDPSKD